jgi:hypothetical protein
MARGTEIVKEIGGQLSFPGDRFIGGFRSGEISALELLVRALEIRPGVGEAGAGEAEKKRENEERQTHVGRAKVLNAARAG